MTDPSTTREAWTLGRMYFQLDRPTESYVLSHSLDYGVAGKALVNETAALGDPAVMMIAKEQYGLFRFLAAQLQCRRALDLGTFTGLSALALAEGMGPEGRVTTIDRNPVWVDIARKHWLEAGVSERIDVRVGEASDLLHELAADPSQRFDIAFLDVDKARIRDYFEATLALLEPRGLIMIDNALWHGWVLDETRVDPDTVGMRSFNDWIAGDTRLEAVILPVADGLTLIRRR